MSVGKRALLDDSGMSTVEYAICTLAAAGLAVVLYGLVTGDWTLHLLQSLLQRAFTVTV
jgi:hypothetical protein